MRLVPALTPGVVACAEDLPLFMALPRGCALGAEQLLAEYGVKLAVADQRYDGAPLEYKFDGELTTIQKEAARTLLAHHTGVFVAPPGIGKTVLGTYLVAQRARSALILVHRKPLLEQWVAQLAMFLYIDEKDVGQIGGGKHRPNGRLDVAMIQSLVRKEKVDDLVAGYGHVIVDECHHLPAISFERVLSEVKARYLVGLTATPQRRDEDEGTPRLSRPTRVHSGHGRTARPRDRPLHRRGVRRRPSRHALPRDAGLLEGNADPVQRSPPPSPSRQDRGSHLRLRGRRGPDASADVQEAAHHLPRHRLRARRGAARVRRASRGVDHRIR